MNGRFYVVKGRGQPLEPDYRTARCVTTRNKANRVQREFEKLYDWVEVEPFDQYKEAQSAIDQFMLKGMDNC